MKTSALVEGVRSMRLLYGMDTPAAGVGGSPDGIIDAWHRCDLNDPCDLNLWTQVMWVRVSLLAENLEDSPGYNDNRIYDLGSGFTIGPINDRRKRHVYTATVTLPNRTGPYEGK
jgi:type IV pilus assembly protein PilW